MKRLFLVCLTALVVLSPTIAGVPGAAIESNVVKITVRSSPPDLVSPWRTLEVMTASGSGVLLNDRRILTNAHVVEDAVSVEVQRAGMAKPYTATVEFVGHDCDLALLSVDDEAFFKGAGGIPLGTMPGLKDAVQVHGFPVGRATRSSPGCDC
jgi:S1-C subfamily serine protease